MAPNVLMELKWLKDAIYGWYVFMAISKLLDIDFHDLMKYTCGNLVI